MAPFYQRLLHLTIGDPLGQLDTEQFASTLVNEGLMTFFFFLVGMELRREILVGELAVWRQAGTECVILPLVHHF